MSRNIVHRSIWTAAGAVLFLAMLAQPARAQFGEEMAVIMQTLNQLNQTIMKAVSVPLNNVNTIAKSVNTFQQTVMYPLAKIQQAQMMANGFLSVIKSGQNLFQSPLNSATLPETMALEQQLLGGTTGSIGSLPGNMGGIPANYTRVFGVLPATTAIPTDTRMVVDMSDAQAQAAMKKAVQLDGIANQEEQVSQQLMLQLATAAPGTASLISAQAAAWNLQAQGYTQGGFAQLLRLDSAGTAYSGYEMKHMSASHQNANQSIQTILNQH